MNSRARQLLLEALLLSERYSADDIQWVRRELGKYPNARGIAEILHIFKGGTERSDDLPTTNNSVAPLTLPEQIKAFTEQLGSGRTARERQRLTAVARRLGIDPKAPPSEALKEIEKRLNSLDPSDAGRLLSRYKFNFRADSGYVGLANFLIKKN